MDFRSFSPWLPAALAALTLAACRDSAPAFQDDATVVADTGAMGDGGPPGDTGPRGDGGPGADGGPSTDSGPQDMTCANAPIPDPIDGTCTYTAGTGGALLVRGNLVVPSGLLENAHLLVGDDGKILCAECDCSSHGAFATASKLECKDGLVSPGLINAHDHITYNEGPPAPSRAERYEHRHDWRTGRNSHTRIPSPRNSGGELGVRWAEIRNLMAGGTAINGSGNAAGLIRNLDKAAGLEGLMQTPVKYQTFPLDDSRGTTHEMGCTYGTDRDTAADIASADSYTPHISEGIDAEALNEFTCLSGGGTGASDVVTGKTALIHGVALGPVEFKRMADVGASLIWSPRSNIDLYGETAMVTVARTSGVRIALGTDWVATGSMNMLRELTCAADYNRLYLDGAFSDRELIDFATINSAAALASDDMIGALRPGLYADVAIYDGKVHRGYRALLDAAPDDVALVMRAGTPLYGDDSLIASMLSGGDRCEALDVCGRAKSLCVERDTGSTLSAIKAAIRSDAYDLFFCGTPPSEPSCLPTRPGEFTGMSMPDDPDGDGLVGAADRCPTVFDPPRELDNGQQPNSDGDAVGDACDPCPLNADTETCSAGNPNDRDNDGHDNATDNCPVDPNPDQADRDVDRIGDVCDSCPDFDNSGGAACPATIYQVKQQLLGGEVQIPNVLVTAVAPTGFFVQTVAGDADFDPVLGAQFSGMFNFTNTAGAKPAVGDRISLKGSVNDFFGQMQLQDVSFTVISSGNALPAPVMVSATDLGAYGTGMQLPVGTMRPDMPYEGVLVQVTGVVVADANPPPGPGDSAPTHEIALVGGLRIGDLLYTFMPVPAVGTRIASVIGVLRFANEWAKIEPRSAMDVSGSAELVSIDPPFTFATVGSAQTLTVTLSRTATQATAISLSSSSGDVTVPSQVVVPSGSDRVNFAPTVASATSGASTTITATLRSVTVTAQIRAYDDASPRRIVAIELDATTLPVGGMTSGRLALDLPAPSGGARVTLTVSPSRIAGVMPGTATIAAGMVDLGFLLVATSSTGTGTISASIGTDTATVGFTVTRSISRPVAGPGDLVITEIHVNPSGSSETNREWFEVHNPTADTLSLDRLIVADNTASNAFTVPAGHSIAPGGYQVFAASDNAGTNGGIMGAIGYGTRIALANGGDRVTLRLGMTVIDEVAYTSAWPVGDGRAMCLTAPYGDNAVARSWARSTGTFGTSTDQGSPGVESTAANCQ